MSAVPEACDVPIELRMRANVFVKGLPADVNSQDLYSRFSSFGQILSAKVVKNEEGTSLGYGYIQFASAEGACHAIASPPEGLCAQRFMPKNERDKQRTGFTNIYVRNFPKSVASEENLKALFEEFGNINSVFLAKGDDNNLKGFGFVNFEFHKDAEQAVKVMNDKKIGNRKLYVAAAQTKEERARILAGWVAEQDQPKGQPPLNGETVIVKNLPYCTNGTDLRKLFEPFGEIYLTKIAVMNDGKSRGFGFVHFETHEAAHKAVKGMHLTKVGGRRISVSLTAKKAVVEAPAGVVGPMNPLVAMPAPQPHILPSYQFYSPYQYPIVNQESLVQSHMHPKLVSSPVGYLSSHSSDDMGSSPMAQSPQIPEKVCSPFQHGTGSAWNQPYYWPPSTGAGCFASIIGHRPSNPYGMMAHAPHVIQGATKHPAGH